MARSKLDDAMHNRIVELLEMGATDTDVCEAVGISRETFYAWLREGEEAAKGKKADFSDAVARARSTARLDAIETLKRALDTSQQKNVTVEEFSETRLNSEGKPYTYTRKKTRQQVSETPGDWRAAIEYLKRRDNNHWSDKIDVTINSQIRAILPQLLKEIESAGLDASDVFNAMLSEIASADADSE